MKKSISSFIFAMAALSVFFFSSCEIGLGEEVDLEGPSISVTSLTSGGHTVSSGEFAGGVYCQKLVRFTGTAEDNVKVKSVHAEIKWSNENDYKYLDEAHLSGNEWIFEHEFEKEGAVYIKFVAEDEPGNVSIRSSTVLTLYVDDTAPTGTAWYIDRGNGFTYNLQNLSTLKNLNLKLPENKDSAQNEQFSIHADFNDTMGIKDGSVKIRIRDENHNTICVVENSAESLYAPRFDITEEMLVQNHSELVTGKHYLQVYYDAEDVVTLPASNKVEAKEVAMGWFLWYPESDEPQIVPQATEVNDIINLNIKDTLSISVFDDDGLYGEHTFKLVDSNGQNESSQTIQFNGERDMTITLKAPGSPMNMTLTGSAEDKKDDPANQKQTSLNKNVNVIDGASPILIISSPENNKIPSVSMLGSGSDQKATITIKGETLDTLGCKTLEFVWVPDSVTNDHSSKISKARAWLDLEGRIPNTPTSGTSIVVTNSEGLKMWTVKLQNKAKYGETSFYKQDFEFTVDMLNDFKYTENSLNVNEKGNDKFFYIKLTRESGKAIYQEYKLLNDNETPKINVLVPSGDMSFVESDKDLTLQFEAYKSSGLAMNKSSYKIERVDVPKTLKEGASDDGYCTYKIDKSVLETYAQQEIKPKFKFSASDIFGNEGSVEYTIVVSNLPKLNSITVNSPNPCIPGDEIILNANFSDTVYVDDNLEESKRPYIELKGFKNGNTAITKKAYCKYGSDGKAIGNGSTSIQFSYVVQENDTTKDDSVELAVAASTKNSPIDINQATKLKNDIVHLSNVDWTDSVASKNIKVDGIIPTVSSITFETDAVAANKNETKKYTYLKEGKKLTANVNISEAITLQGTPSLEVTVGSDKLELNIDTSSSTTTKLVFTTTIPDKLNGEIKYVESTCIKDSDVVKDAAGNTLKVLTGTDSKSAKEGDNTLIVDTKAPVTPTIKNASGATLVDFASSANYREKVTFQIPTPKDKDGKEINDPTKKTIEYSLNGGSTWPDNQTVSFDTNEELSPAEDAVYQLTARIVDFAGNVSDYPDPVTLDIRKAFPSFTLECTDSNGYYKAGETIHFKVTFTSKVNIAANSQAKIYLSGANTDDIVTSGAAATLTSTAVQTGVSSATFSYTVKKTDQFKLKVSKDLTVTDGNGGTINTGVHLDGFTDPYGFAQGTRSFSTTTDFTRNITCDGVIPYITSMSSTGEKEVSVEAGKDENGEIKYESLKVYPNGNVITLTFNEPVQKGSGNIILRQVKGWAIPPVIDGDDFNTICNELSASDKEILAMRKSSTDDTELEDSESLFSAKVGPANDRYHGTGQYVGPYKKTTQGLLSDYSPNLNTKYVLDFDIDIWETTETHPIGQTFIKGRNSGNEAADKYPRTSTSNYVNPETPTTTRSADQIRTVLETAGYHQRVLDVTSGSVRSSATGKSYTITFPKGLTGGEALADGREWELVVEKGAFLDYTQNEFGEEYTSTSATVYTKTKAAKDAIMKKNATAIENVTATNAWRRGRTSVTSGNGLVLIQTSNGNNSFWSDKVAEPVIRVDRYSYGLGFKQGTASGGTEVITKDSVIPSGYVRVRIDCETRGATIKYGVDTKSNNRTDQESTTVKPVKDYYYANTDNSACYSYISKTTGLKAKNSVTLSTPTTYDGSDKTIDQVPIIFAGGNGHYNQSCKQIIVAQGVKGSGTSNDTKFLDSELGIEGVFQTVVRFNAPYGNSGKCAAQGAGKTDLSIRGTTGFAGEPSISPFPLRDSQIASPFLRRCFRERSQGGDYATSDDYYWVSYDILVDASFSGYSWHNDQKYDWCQNWGKMMPGEFTHCVGLKNWN